MRAPQTVVHCPGLEVAGVYVQPAGHVIVREVPRLLKNINMLGMDDELGGDDVGPHTSGLVVVAT